MVKRYYPTIGGGWCFCWSSCLYGFGSDAGSKNYVDSEERLRSSFLLLFQLIRPLPIGYWISTTLSIDEWLSPISCCNLCNCNIFGGRRAVGKERKINNNLQLHHTIFTLQVIRHAIQCMQCTRIVHLAVHDMATLICST